MSHESQTFKLPKTLYLQGYGCAVMNIKAIFEPHHGWGDLFLCSNFTKECFVDDITLPVLRHISWKPDNETNRAVCDETFDKMLWLPLVRDKVEEVSLFICNRQGHIPSFQNLQLSCTLLFIPRLDSL